MKGEGGGVQVKNDWETGPGSSHLTQLHCGASGLCVGLLLYSIMCITSNESFFTAFLSLPLVAGLKATSDGLKSALKKDFLAASLCLVSKAITAILEAY